MHIIAKVSHEIRTMMKTDLMITQGKGNEQFPTKLRQYHGAKTHVNNKQ